MRLPKFLARLAMPGLNGATHSRIEMPLVACEGHNHLRGRLLP